VQAKRLKHGIGETMHACLRVRGIYGRITRMRYISLKF